ncbi:PAS/PAC sensor signal transduction histidine kinase [Candidatus Magnetoovum chiemensis]|nr:PAS/PAC sensor signal transduction histidine kinase [Candidatus Magnetoovum chiemensis]
MLDRLLAKILNISAIVLVVICLFVSEGASLVIVSFMSYVYHGRITEDYLVTSVIASLFVSLVVVSMLGFFINRLKSINSQLIKKNDYIHKILNSFKHTAIIEADAELNIRFYNTTALLLFSDMNRDLSGLNLKSLTIGGINVCRVEDIREHVDKDIEYTSIVQYQGISGAKHIDVNISKIYTDECEASEAKDNNGYLLIIKDITEQKNIQKKLLYSEQKFRFMFESSPVMMQTIDSSGSVSDVNFRWIEKTGYTKKELLGKTANYILQQNFTGKVMDYIRPSSLMEDQCKLFSCRIITKKQEIIDVLLHICSAVDPEGMPMSIAAAVDVTQKNAAERALKAQLNFLQVLIDAIPNPVFYKDVEGRYLGCNKAFEQALGLNKEYVKGKTVYDISPKQLADIYHAKDMELLRTRTLQIYETKVKYADGSEHDIIFNKAIFSDADNNIAGLVGIMLDITRRKHIEAQLAQSELRFRTLIEQSPLSTAIFTPEGYIITVNKAFTDLWRIDDSSMENFKQKYCIFKDGELRRRGIMSYVEKGFSGDFLIIPPIEYEVFIEKTSSALKRWIRFFIYAVKDANGSVKEAVLIQEDVTAIIHTQAQLDEKRKELESWNSDLQKKVIEEIEKNRAKEQFLIHQSKVAAMGEMIATIAHQWRQPLNALGMIIQDMPEAYHFGELNDDYLEKTVKDAMEQIKFMSDTVDDFRNFFRHDKEKVDFDLIKAISSVLTILSAQFTASGIIIKVRCKKDTSAVRFDELKKSQDYQFCENYITGYPNEFKQVMLNILNNAKDAILDRKQSELTNSADTGIIEIALFTENDNVVNITVQDNGGGIAPDVIERIFDPYFTTKQDAKGTGIGLYISKMIIETNMGGRLYAANTAQGAIFTIKLKMSNSKKPSLMAEGSNSNFGVIS